MVPLICREELGWGLGSDREVRIRRQKGSKEAAKISDRDCAGASHMRFLSVSPSKSYSVGLHSFSVCLARFSSS